MRTVLVLLALTPLLLVGLIMVPIPVEAAPIFFEDDFRGCADGTSPPPGWTASGSTSALVDECSDDQFFPNVVNGTLPGFGPIEGDTSFHIKRTDFTCCPVGSHTASFSTSGASLLSAGFAFRYANLGFQPIFLSDFCETPGAFEFHVNEAGMGGPAICVDGDDPPNQDIDSLFAIDANSASWVDTGVNLVNNTWYRFRFDINLATNSYTLWMNETLISTRNAGSGNDIDTITIRTRGSRVDQAADTEVYVDWFFVGQHEIDPVPDLTATLCLPEGAAEQTILDASSDATTDVFWGLVSPPIWLSIAPGTGRVFLHLIPFQGPPALGTILVTLKANVSSGQDTEQFNLTVQACDPFSWIREFGPTWVLFLAFVAIFVFIGMTLWRGAKGKLR